MTLLFKCTACYHKCVLRDEAHPLYAHQPEGCPHGRAAEWKRVNLDD